MAFKYHSFEDWSSDLVTGNRILVLGCPGSGKSTFSKALGLGLKKPVFHIDDEYWAEGWKRSEDGDFQQRLLKIATQEQWILDGNYADYLNIRLAYADTVIVLDISPLTCLYRVTLRSIKRLTGDTESLPKAIRKNPTFRPRLNRKFLLKIVLFQKNTMPSMKQELAKFAKKGEVHWLRK